MRRLLLSAAAVALLTAGCGEDLPQNAQKTAKTGPQAAAPPAAKTAGKSPARSPLEAPVGGTESATPLDAYFQALLDARTQAQYLQVKIQLKQALDLHRFSPQGFPKKWEESWATFEKELLEPNHIHLPELPDGQRYVFDRKRGEVMVEPAP